jgi:hypothetical protein
LIRTKQLNDENKRISASVTHYYDVIGEEEMEENRSWGQFAETQFREDPRSPALLLKNAAPKLRKVPKCR